MPGELVAVAIVFIVVGLPVMAFTLITLAKILKGTTGSSETHPAGDDAELIQQIYHGLNRMEKRIEALETIIIDRERNKEKTFQ